MRSVQALSASSEAIWAATTGGVFSYAPASGELQRFTAAEGLNSVQTQAIAYDAQRGLVWVGYRDGVIDQIDVASGAVQTFFDIFRNDRFPTREINRLSVRGDSLLVATSFGLVIFDPIRGEVRDTYSQLGTLPAATPVHDVIVAPIPDGRTGFWLATMEGVAFAPLDATNLQDPNAWSVDQAGLPSRETYSMAYFAGSVYAGTAAGLARRQGDGTYQRLNFTNRIIPDLAVSDRLLAIDDFKFYAIDASGGTSVLADGFIRLNAVVDGPDGNHWIGDGDEGLNGVRELAGGGGEVAVPEVYPDGPFDGLFGNMAVDGEGRLWAATVENTPNSGFYRLDTEGQWTNFTSRFFDELAGRSNFTNVHVGPNGTLWTGSIGHGLAQVTPEEAITMHDATNSSLRPAPGTVSFVPITGAGSDKDGRLWVTNREASPPLHTRSTSGDWTAVPTPVCQGLPANAAFRDLLVDSFEQKWIMVLQASDLRVRRGVLLLDTGDSASDSGDDACRYLREAGSGGQGLPSITITSFAEDREGRVWIGTDEGPAFVISSSVAAQDNTAIPIWPQWARRPEGGGPFVLSGLHINDIAVDPSNRIWIATNEGAFLIQEVEGGFEQAEHFTAENSPLFSNIVVAIAVNGVTGEVYFSTDQGMISFRGDAIEPVTKARDLFVYPNPVQISEGNVPDIFIEGLVEETDVRVVAPHGEVVARFSARGGRVRWDGRDQNKQIVPSGVYLVVAVGQNGEGTAFGKVAVIR